VISLTTLLRDIAESMEHSEAEAARAAAKAKAYNGPWRRKTDAINVDARVVESLPAPTEARKP